MEWALVISLRNSNFLGLGYAYDIFNILDILSLNMLIHFTLVKRDVQVIKSKQGFQSLALGLFL